MEQFRNYYLVYVERDWGFLKVYISASSEESARMAVLSGEGWTQWDIKKVLPLTKEQYDFAVQAFEESCEG
jgi:hypothetical protein